MSANNLSPIEQQNRELAERINAETLRDPHSIYRGKFVGIANGQIVVVSDDLDEIAKRLLEAEPDPRKTFCIEAGRDYDAVEFIWSAL